MIIPFDNEILKNWFLDYLPTPPYFGCMNDVVISTVGSEPYDETFFDKILIKRGLKVNPIKEDTDVLIIGQEDWNEEDLDELLNLREGEQLKVYSQEMFLAYWVTGQDPFDDEQAALAFTEGHPALEYLLSCWVDWVSTNVSRNFGGGNLGLDDSPEIGVLKHLGYTVGKTKGLHSPERQKILAKLFNSHLYEILSAKYVRDCKLNYPQYLEEWGMPKSERRLIKMRDFLSTNCKQQKRKGERYSQAASDYEDDLEWLRVNFHKGRFKFDWVNYRID